MARLELESLLTARNFVHKTALLHSDCVIKRALCPRLGNWHKVRWIEPYCSLAKGLVYSPTSSARRVSPFLALYLQAELTQTLPAQTILGTNQLLPRNSERGRIILANFTCILELQHGSHRETQDSHPTSRTAELAILCFAIHPAAIWTKEIGRAHV